MEQESQEIIKDKILYPVLPLRDIVLFPHMVVPLFVGREKSVRALDSVMSENKQILLVAQKDANIDEPTADDLYKTGTLATVLQLLRLPDGTVKVLVEGGKRAHVDFVMAEEPFFEAYATVISEPKEELNDELNALARSVMEQFERYASLNRRLPPEVWVSVSQIQDYSKMADVICSHLTLKVEEKQHLLEINTLSERLEALFTLMEKEINVLQVEKKIRKRVKTQMEKSQKEYYLNEQMKAIQKELGDDDEGSDLNELKKKIKAAHMPKEANEKALSDLRKLKMMGPMSAEASVLRNYLDWMISIPWKKYSPSQIDLKKAEDILNKDHYGLEKVKERILEYLAVLKKSGGINGPILCLVGPPGVGKTSLGQSIAKATGRHFVRASLGGMHDEAEIRGHRRTYIGAMPGKIIQGMKKAKTLNTLFLLDEIDKVGADWRGDPSSALLEVLDPEQNTTFNDHYLEVDYDLSGVMFITTANTLKMPRPLLDRMEIIQLSGYTEDEKVEIAKRHLIEKQMKAAALSTKELTIDDSAIRDLIRLYTREAGVRNLEREIANLCRKAVKELMTGKKKTVHITHKNLSDYAGIARYSFGIAEKEDQVGVATGLAWTEVGGEMLSVEAVVMPGKGNITLTGQLGDVMKESVEAACSYIRANHITFGIPSSVFEKNDIHVHVPEGATPKDGPSAGITMCTALVSALTGVAIHNDLAMTGEITLRGRVLPIGGLKEKLLAALRGGIKTVLIPTENQKDLAEIPENVKKGLQIIPVNSAKEVLEHALVKPLIPLPEEVSICESKEESAKAIN
ncbi:MAG: endopeptidase La [Alphaproteobacteria bacterium]